MIRRNNKIVSAILAMTIASGLVTPVSATEMVSDNSADQVFNLENADLEKISDDTDILEEVSETEEVKNNETSVEDAANNSQDNGEQTEENKESNDSVNSSEEDNEAKEEADVPLDDSIDEEMENYLKEYLHSSKAEVSDEEFEKFLQEYLDKINVENTEIDDEELSQLKDGLYSLNNSVLKVDSDEESMLRKYLSDEINLEVEDGKISVILTFDKNVNTLDNYKILINDKNAKYKTLKSNDSVLIIKFNINSIEDNIVLKTDIKNDYFVKSNEECRVLFDMASLTEIENEVEDEDDSNELKNGTYIIKNNVLKFDDNKESVLGNYLSNNSILEVKNGEKYITLTFDKNVEAINDYKIYVNSYPSSCKILKSSENIIKVKFKMEDLDDDIVIDTNVTNEYYSEKLMAKVVLDEGSIQKYENEAIEANELENIDTNDTLADGSYSIECNIFKTGTQNNSALLRYVTESILQVKNEKKTVILKVDNKDGMIKKLTANVNSKDVEVSTKEKDGTITMKFAIESLEDKISIGMSIDTGIIGVMTHSADYVINEVVERDPYVEDVEYEEVIEEDTSLKDGEYTIKSSILNIETGEPSMASGYFSENSDLSVKDGKYTVTVNCNGLSMMSDIKVTVGGDTVKTDIVRNNNGTGTISFEIPKLNSKIIMGCHVNAGSHSADYEFILSLDKKTIVNKETNEGVEAPEEGIELENNTIYKVTNEVKAVSNESSSKLAAYLEPESIIEVDSKGGIYLTLNFTMSGLMNGRTIRLNDSESVTSYAVVNSNNTNGIRFKINSLTDKIHISDQYGSTINDGFSLAILEDTVEKTGTISGSGSGNGTTGDDTSSSDEDDDIEDGTYVIKNYCYKENSDTTSDARKYLDTESVLVVKNSKKYVILKFTHGKMMSDTSIKVDGTKTSYTEVKNSGNKYYIKFKIDSLSDEIMVTSTIDTGVSSIGVIKGVKFRVVLRQSTLDEDDDAADFGDEPEVEEETKDEGVKVEEPVQDVTVVVPPSSGGIENNTDVGQSKKSTYKVNNEIVTDSQIGYQAARGAVNQTTLYEIEDEKKYITLGFSQTDILNNIRISNNGKNIAYTVVNEDKSKNTMNIRFEVPSLSTQLTVTANVTAMGRDISFGLKFLETTLELISTEEFENITNNTGSESNGSSSSSGMLSGLSSTMSSLFSGGSSSEGGIEVSEEASEDIASLAKEYFKKYTVNNEVISDSAIGRTMARKYLSETSIIEEIDGQLYATITFSSASSMGSFRIDVNGETVSHTIPLKDMGSDLISLRFPINSVNDEIRTFIFISPMKMTIDFGIKFLESTMTLIDEGTAGEDENDKSGSLADTLTELNQTSQGNKNQVSTVKIAASTSVMVIVLNQGIAGLAGLFKRFKNKSLLNNIKNIE